MCCLALRCVLALRCTLSVVLRDVVPPRVLALLHPYLQCAHSAATVAKVGPLALVSALAITYEGRLY